jgi:hypothetical protein
LLQGISANQLSRTLGVTLKTAWFLGHRIREAMQDPEAGPLGGEGKTVEADDTFFGNRDDVPEPDWVFINNVGWRQNRKQGYARKIRIVSLVERGGKARSIKVETLGQKEVAAIVLKHADRKSVLHTDEAPVFGPVGRRFASHETVNHSQEEYARGSVTTNTVEGFFGVFKRGMRGIYQHCAPHHLQRYLTEFDFRYNNRMALGYDDVERADAALRGVVGRRLTYRTTRNQTI